MWANNPVNNVKPLDCTPSSGPHLPVNTFDKRPTNAEAERVLIQSDLYRKRLRNLTDNLAAMLILQGYLESRKKE